MSAVKLVNDPNCVRGWVAKLSAEPGLAPAGEGALMAEVRQLRKENARLLMEPEI